MSVQTTQVEIATLEVARARLITGLIVLAVMAGSCAPQIIQKAQTQPPAAAAAAR